MPCWYFLHLIISQQSLNAIVIVAARLSLMPGMLNVYEVMTTVIARFLWWIHVCDVLVLPSANLVLEIIDFVYPFYVYDGNRPLAPILRQRRCSLMYDVYWLALDNDVQQKRDQNTWNTIQDQNWIFYWWIWTMKIESNKNNRIKQKSNKDKQGQIINRTIITINTQQ